MKIKLKLFICTILILITVIGILPKKVLASQVKQEVKTGIEAFPESYQKYLKELKQLHPNWNFEAYYTGIEWNELIYNETGNTLHKRSVVPASYGDAWKCNECEEYNGWNCASETAVKYFIDPRNFLDEIHIFQFEELSFNEKVHTLESIEKSVQSTFLKNSVTYYDEEAKKNVTKTYSQIILEVAKQTNMSPFHIKSKIIQEVGSQGSASISGTYKGYEGLYNFFNYGAHDTGDPIANGLEFARQNGWTNPYKAILGGAKLIGNAYIEAGQNTSYFFKFDVVGDSILKAGQTRQVDTGLFYKHQYMTNIMDPYSQSSSVYNMYAANGNLDASLNFIIPVYNNMPELNTRPTKYTENDGELYYATKIASVKDSPTYASDAVYTMSKLEIAVMISRKNILSDGVYWDIVMLENGWQCYVQSDFISPCKEETTTNKQPEKAIVNEKEATITITPNTTIEKIIETLKCTNYNMVNNAGQTIEKEKIATGYKINVLKEDKKTITKTYTIIKVGDVNGDGKVIAVDALAILKHSTGKKKLDSVYLQAADVKKNGKIQAVDALSVLKYSTGKSIIDI